MNRVIKFKVIDTDFNIIANVIKMGFTDSGVGYVIHDGHN